jgi:hypothetical protein
LCMNGLTFFWRLGRWTHSIPFWSFDSNKLEVLK